MKDEVFEEELKKFLYDQVKRSRMYFDRIRYGIKPARKPRKYIIFDLEDLEYLLKIISKYMNTDCIVNQHEDSQAFLREFNSNKVSEEFLDSCKKAGELFGRK